MEKSIAILWQKQKVQGSIQLINQGKLCTDPDFSVEHGRLAVTVADAKLTPGSFATMVTVRTEKPFSFFLRDVRKDMPIWIPEYQAAVTEADDSRIYEQIEAENLQVFADTTTFQNLEMIPLAEFPAAWDQTVIYNTPPQNL